VGYTNPKRKRGNQPVDQPPSLTLRVSAAKSGTLIWQLKAADFHGSAASIGWAEAISPSSQAGQFAILGRPDGCFLEE
jgi:hypothetical protein